MHSAKLFNTRPHLSQSMWWLSSENASSVGSVFRLACITHFLSHPRKHIYSMVKLLMRAPWRCARQMCSCSVDSVIHNMLQFRLSEQLISMLRPYHPESTPSSFQVSELPWLISWSNEDLLAANALMWLWLQKIIKWKALGIDRNYQRVTIATGY